LRVRTLASVAGLMASLSCRGAPEKAPDAPAPRTHTVAMELVKFQPEKLSVNTGDSVVWVNKDMVPHTVVSKTGGFDSRDVAAGASWTFTAKTPGEFEYVCTLHPVMKAVLQVK
jgi:plastocyanin